MSWLGILDTNMTTCKRLGKDSVMTLREARWRFSHLRLTPQKLSPPNTISDGVAFVESSLNVLESTIEVLKEAKRSGNKKLEEIKMHEKKRSGSFLKEYYDALIVEQGEPNWDELRAKQFPNPVPHFDGKAYEAEFDYSRLSNAIRKTYECMKDGKWRTLAEICEVTGGREASESARLRDFRKEKYGNHTVDRRRRGNPKDGLFEYRLIT